MAYKKRTKRAVSEIIPDEEEMMEEGVQDFSYSEGGSGGGFFKFIVTILIIAIILVGGWYVIDNYTDISLPGMSTEASPSGWQAVFLSNGQVYFGQIKKSTEHEIVLTDIYYLQVIDKPLQQGQVGEDGAPAGQPQTQQELTLTKLGTELHGPTDQMNINRDHVLMTEELREDSKVVTAIDAYINPPGQE
jgi:hypothetical protein